MVESRTDPAFDESQSKGYLLFGLKSLKSSPLQNDNGEEDMGEERLGKLVASLG